MPEAAALITLEHCSVKFDEHLALRDVSFTLRAGERWVLVGANGSGKSVLLKLLRGDMWPTPLSDKRPARRRYCFDGESHDQPLFDKHRIGYLAPERQDKYVRYDWNLSVTQVVTTGLFDEDIPLSRPTAAEQARVQRLLRRLRLWSLRQRRFLSLSYGQRRRVLLARLLASKPTVWLLDEVFNGLDDGTRRMLRDILEDAREAHTWILAAHSADDIPASATHLLHLQRGAVKHAGPIEARHAHIIHRDERERHLRAHKRVAAKPLLRARPIVRDSRVPLLQLKNVQLFRQYRPVLRAVDWTVRQGEHWAIMGDNGSGKSTLLMMLYGDLHPADGGIIERAGCPRGTPIAQWKRHVGYVSPELQADHVWTHTLEELVASGRYASVGLNQKITTGDRRLARPWLEFFGIAELAKRSLRKVSYGQLRLALLARAMVNRPQLLLLDEPFTGLDPEMHAYVMALLQRLATSGTQVIMAVHDRADVPPAVGKVLHIRRGGKVVLEKRNLP
jgi:molybdate transport system ATP-binding protein